MPYRLFLPMLVTVLCLASGCVRMPQPQGFPYSNQPKMQAAHHWNVLANDVANRINNELALRKTWPRRSGPPNPRSAESSTPSPPR